MSQTDFSTRIHQLVQRWAAAELSGDVQELDELLAADFRAIGPLGFVLDRARWQQRYASGDLVNEAFEITEVEPRRYGSVAVVNAVQTQKSAHRGNPSPGNFRLTLVAAEKPADPQGWDIVNIQLSPIANIPR
jgi:hypothetical protein